MIEIYILLLINSLFITGLYTLTMYEKDQKGRISTKMPLWWVRFHTWQVVGDIWIKPLFACVVCMTSYWGTLFYWTFLIIDAGLIGVYADLSTNSLIYVLYLICLAGIQKIVCHLINEC